MTRNKQANQQSKSPVAGGEDPKVKIIIAVIAALGLIVVALINRSTALETALKPIESTQTAEAKSTQLVLSTTATAGYQTPITDSTYYSQLEKPIVLLERLQATFLGVSSNNLVGSGCPGDYGRGLLENYQLQVRGVDSWIQVTRILVLGNIGTATWELPCSDNWELVAQQDDSDPTTWDIHIAVSTEQTVYTVIFFYEDETMAVGVAVVP